MFGFMVTADGGLTTAGYVITVIAGIILFFWRFILQEEFRQEKAYHKATGILCRSYCTCFYYVLSENLQTAVGGSVTLCSMLFIVLIANWYGVGTGIMAGFAYGILQFIQEPYILSFFRCAVITYLHLRHLDWQDYLQTESWTSERIHNSCNCQRSFSFSGRLSLLDELYARQFPKISDSRISDLIQLQLSAGRGHYHGDHHFSTCGVKSTDPGKACRTAVVCFVWQQGCVVARYSEHLV